MHAFASPLPLQQTHPTPLRSRATTLAVAQRIVHAFSSAQPLHPVLQVLKHRIETGSKPGRRNDGRRVALCIEGGGMRGAVAAGMCAAIKYCGYENAFDVVYGCSAGAIVGAYFVSRQLPRYGARIYYDEICSAENGQRFIDLWALRHHPYLRLGKSDAFYANGARPVLLLDLLIDDVMRERRPLDWNAFEYYNNNMPLKPVASSLKQMKATALADFTNLDQLLEGLRASARVPGIAGDPVQIGDQLFADGLLFEPIPYRSAVREGATDVLVLRTKPDAAAQKGTKPGIYERHIAAPYFDMLPTFAPRAKVSDYLHAGGHIHVYNEDLRRLREENLQPGQEGANIFSITPPSDAPVVGQLEARARVVHEGVRNGFAAAYDVLSPFAEFNLERGNVENVKTSRGEERKMKITSGGRIASLVFTEEEIQEVEKKHGKVRRERARRANREKNGSFLRSLRKKRRRGKEEMSTIEEKFFVG